MASTAVARKKGKAWGNAKGGYKLQKRDKNGRFVGLSIGAGLHQKAKKRGGGFVPYSRHGLGHHTVGVNTGVSLSSKRRVSAGVYIRTDSRVLQKTAKQVATAQSYAQAATASQITEDTPWLNIHARTKLRRMRKMQGRSTSYAEALVRNTMNKRFRRAVGAERQVPTALFSNAHARVGTDMNGLPTLIIQHNSPHDKKKRSRDKRDKATTKYNKMVTKTRGHKYKGKVKKARPQRRKKARG